MSNNTPNYSAEFNSIQTLQKFISHKTKDLDPEISRYCLMYSSQRVASTWDEMQVDTLITLVRYERAYHLLATHMDSFNKENLSDPKELKRFVDLSRAVNTASRDLSILKGGLGLSLSYVHGDKRTLTRASERGLELREISTDGNGTITDLSEARERAKRMLLEVNGS
jgi:hypothetical protein